MERRGTAADGEGEAFRSGFVSLTGKPNVGKSTLINALVGEKIAAVSPKPNTTRNRIAGVVNVPGAQLVFLDTPGIHRARQQLNKRMVKVAIDAMADVDVVGLVLDAENSFDGADRYIVELVPRPFIAIVNKIDKVRKGKVLEIMAACKELGDRVLEVVPVSAVTGEGLSELVGVIRGYLPPGPRYFPDDTFTDQPERLLVAELIREKIFNLTRQELPYKTAVAVREFLEDEEHGIVRISADIVVETKGQKKIVIGRGGEMLKRIGTLARQDIERLLGTKVYLELWVKVRKEWTKKPRSVEEYVYGY